jgi:2-methylcitrate dehydratase PrpD
VAGEGEYLQFHEDRIFPSSYFLNAPITLRVDAKDGRARISVILSYYTGKRSNINESEDIHDRISEFQPVNESQTERRKLYNAAFPVLFQKAQKTLKEVEEVLKSTRSSVPDTDW